VREVNARLLLCVVILLSGCPRVEGVDVSAAREFYRQPTSVQQKTFRQHSLEDQLGLFFFGNQVRHPPAIYLADCFALNGAPAVELLRSKLEVANDDLTVRDIVTLLATIDEMGQYDVAGDDRLMLALKTRAAQMKDKGWRDLAQEYIAKIGHERSERAGVAPECGRLNLR
jgi:hypothetical protein